MKKKETKFPDSPNWEKVEKATDHIIETLDTLNLTFTEKYNTMIMVQSVLDRQFQITNMVSWLDSQYKHEQEEIKKGKTPGTI